MDANWSEVPCLRGAVFVGLRIPLKIAGRECSILTLGLVPNRRMRFDLLLIDQPAEHGG